MTQFIWYDTLEKFERQNKAECVDVIEGSLLDNLLYECKRGTAFIFEERLNCWSSAYRVYFVPYKEQPASPAYDDLLMKWKKLASEIEMEG